MSSAVESTRSSSSSVALLYDDIWKVKCRKDSLSASMFLLPRRLSPTHVCARESVCVWRLFVSGLWGFRVGFPFKIHQEVSRLSRWSSSTRTRELTFRECQPSPFQKHFSSPQQHLSQSPYCLADYPRGQTSPLPPPTKSLLTKVLGSSPCGSLSSSLTVLWLFLGKTFFFLDFLLQSMQTWHQRRRN